MTLTFFMLASFLCFYYLYRSRGGLLKSLLMIALGLALGTVGMETVAGYMRYTFGQPMLAQGIDFLPVAMGLFGISEVLVTAEQTVAKGQLQKIRFRELWPTMLRWIGRSMLVSTSATPNSPITTGIRPMPS